MYLQKISYKLEKTYRVCDSTITNPTAVGEWFRDLKESDRENFIVVCLDQRQRVIGYDHLGKGTVTECPVVIREVIKAPIQTAAASIILVHNHVSGQTKPSEEDLKVTKVIQTACKLFGISLLDHVIVGFEDDDYSMAVHEDLALK